MRKILGVLILVALFTGLVIAQTIVYANEYATSYLASFLFILSLWFIALTLAVIVVFAIILIMN